MFIIQLVVKEVKSADIKTESFGTPISVEIQPLLNDGTTEVEKNIGNAFLADLKVVVDARMIGGKDDKHTMN
ncbi:MAG: hypothetical protein DRI61_12980 [Chloroflexi bacterium]|nr:MAG: hypothetical protein DRI61_12980 [Chloroflexota bacterium]